jgi:hypothetical protein
MRTNKVELWLVGDDRILSQRVPTLGRCLLPAGLTVRGLRSRFTMQSARFGKAFHEAAPTGMSFLDGLKRELQLDVRKNSRKSASTSSNLPLVRERGFSDPPMLVRGLHRSRRFAGQASVSGPDLQFRWSQCHAWRRPSPGRTYVDLARSGRPTPTRRGPWSSCSQ